MSDIFEWKKKIDCLKNQIKPLRLTPFNWHVQYLDETVKCFHSNLSISCIVVSSALVETCLCLEHFRQNPKETIGLEEFRGDSLNKLFDFFLDTDMPLEFLMDSDEDIVALKKMKKKERKKRISEIKYVKTRNVFAHGDLFYQVINLQTLLPYGKKELQEYGIEEWKLSGTLGLRTVAYVHLSKTLRFMKAFTDWIIQKEEQESRFRKNHLFGLG